MTGIQQDLLGNLIMFCSLDILARKTTRRPTFWLRMLLCFGLFSLIRYGVFSGLLAGLPWNIRQPCLMVAFSAFIPLLMGACLSCWEMDVWAALHCGSSAYCLQHIINAGYDVIRLQLMPDVDGLVYTICYISLAAAVLLFIGLVVKHQGVRRVRIDRKPPMITSLVVIVTAIVLNMLATSALHGSTNEAKIIMKFYNVIAAAMIICYQFSNISSKDKETENKMLHTLLEEQRNQYRFEKSIIDTLNIKVHDIKHQLQGLDEESRRKVMADLSPVLEKYNSRYHTENAALDVVLTRKSFMCHEKQIHLTVMADGKALGFMSDSDIYSLFGNILDNAIEAAEKLEQPEQKVIKLSVEKRGYFVNIHEENYFSDKLQFEDGLPMTTKPEANYHGFGMKSIHMLVHQYDGSVKVITEDNRFILDVMFPI